MAPLDDIFSSKLTKRFTMLPCSYLLTDYGLGTMPKITS